MNKGKKFMTRALSLCLAAAFAATAARSDAEARQASPAPAASQSASAARTTAASTPSQVVLAFYAALRERRFTDALSMSVFRPALEALSPSEIEELRPDFERLAPHVPTDYEVTGEQVSGDDATVFLKSGEGREVKVEPVYLVRERGAWLIGDREGAAAAKKQGKKFFFEQRMAAHEQDAEDMLKRIQAAQIAYAMQNGGLFGDLNALVRAGLVPQDILGTETTGYRFTVTPGPDKRTYFATAEPERHGRTGRLSFYLDPSGVQKKDTGGKPFNPSKK